VLGLEGAVYFGKQKTPSESVVCVDRVWFSVAVDALIVRAQSALFVNLEDKAGVLADINDFAVDNRHLGMNPLNLVIAHGG